jgi:predicted transcriptional regulator
MTRQKGAFIWTTARLAILAKGRAAGASEGEIAARLGTTENEVRRQVRALSGEATGWTPSGSYRMVAMISPRKER